MLLDSFGEGLALILHWKPLLMLAAGVLLGLGVGSLPGLTSTMAIAILLPLSFQFPPLLSIPLLIGIYKGGLYGGAIPAVLVATPGTGGAVATVFDGHPLAQGGKPRKAIQTSLVASTAGDAVSDLVLLFFMAPLALIAMAFGSPEYFALFVFSLVIIAGVTGGSALKGFFSAFLGLLVSLVGIDQISGSTRFTFGSIYLASGVSFVPMMIGLFAVTEVVSQFEDRLRSAVQRSIDFPAGRSDDRLTWREAWRLKRVIFQSSAVGTFVGVVPGLGAPIAAFLAYSFARRTSRDPQRFGKGSLEGIAAPEAANNAVNGANFIPLFAFGIPGDIVAAIMLGAFVVHGMRPGPDLMANHGATMYALIIAMLIGNALLFLFGWFLSRFFAKLLMIPKSILYPAILAVATVGSYSVNNSLFDLKIMLFFGVVGYVMKKLAIPVVPLVIMTILGREIEQALVRSLIILEGDLAGFLVRPLALGFLVLTLIVVTSTMVVRLRGIGGRRQTREPLRGDTR